MSFCIFRTLWSPKCRFVQSFFCLSFSLSSSSSSSSSSSFIFCGSFFFLSQHKTLGQKKERTKERRRLLLFSNVCQNTLRETLSLFHKQKSLKNFQKKRKKDERRKRKGRRGEKKNIFQKRRRRRRRHKIFSLSLFSRCIIRRAPQALKKTKRERSRESFFSEEDDKERERETTKGQKGVAF